MKKGALIRKFQLLKYRERADHVDLTEENVVAIGEKAFSRNKKIESVLLPTELSTVKAQAFAHCKHLKEITLPEARGIGISTGVFQNCRRLKKIENAQMITAIGNQAFKDCYFLEKTDFGPNLRRIGEHAFQNCCSLKELTLCASVETVGKRAFMGCTELEEVTLEEGFSALSKGMLRDCISLRRVDLPTSVAQIPTSTYQNCSAITSLTVPMNVKTIGSSAFRGCTRLEECEIELGCTRIGALCFAEDPVLKAVHVPHSVKYLGFGAFGLKKREEKIIIHVDNEYMLRRMRRQVLLCGSFLAARVVMIGKTIEERKRERRRATVEQKATHIS